MMASKVQAIAFKKFLIQMMHSNTEGDKEASIMKNSNLINVTVGLFAACLLSGCAMHPNKSLESPETALRKAFPKMPFESMEQTDINGLYEVVSGQNIFYYYPEKEYLIFGDIFTMAGKNLTAAKREEISTALVKNLPLDKAVKSGNGKTTVIEFTDPDCPYCRKAHEFFKARTDVTIYSFFSPLAHPAAISKVYYILNAEDRAKAYRDVFEGKKTVEPAEGYSDSIKRLAQEHLDLARSVGVSATPTFFINGNQVVGADIQKIKALLDDDNQQGKDKTENPQ
jgi:thiol:disulfide interchange protein DsbC